MLPTATPCPGTCTPTSMCATCAASCDGCCEKPATVDNLCADCAARPLCEMCGIDTDDIDDGRCKWCARQVTSDAYEARIDEAMALAEAGGGR